MGVQFTDWDMIVLVCAYALPIFAVCTVFFAARSKGDLLQYKVCLGVTLATLLAMGAALWAGSGILDAWSTYWGSTGSDFGRETIPVWLAVVLSIIIVLMKQKRRPRKRTP